MTYKHTVITDDITDIMIHPEPVFGELKSLWKQYLQERSAPNDWVQLNRCVACNGDDITQFFSVWCYRYDRCRGCASVFLNPQPSQSLHKAAFFDSPMSRFVKSPAFQDQHLTRFEKSIHPLLSELIQTSRKQRLRIVELFGRNRHVRDYLLNQPKVEEYFGYETLLGDDSGHLKTLPDLDGIEDKSVDLILLLMCVEQVLSPGKIFPVLSRKLSSDGLMIIIARLGSGIDVQVLRGDHPSIFPLEHINLVSVEGYEHLCREAGLDIIELSTPGLLDSEYLRQHCQKHPDEEDIFQYLFRHRSPLDIQRFQQFIQEVRLSSALKLICKRG